MKYTIQYYLDIGMLDFVILNEDFALNRYCLWSQDHSAHILCYAIVFFIFMFGIDVVSSSLLEELIYKNYHQLPW